jgi:hypothetical protein
MLIENLALASGRSPLLFSCVIGCATRRMNDCFEILALDFFMREQ